MSEIERSEMSGLMLKPAVSAAEAIAARQELEALITQALVSGIDYGVVPGTKGKPTLLKPGAEKVCTWFNLAPEYVVLESERDHDREVAWQKTKWSNGKPYTQTGLSAGLYSAVIKCTLVHRGTGQIAATGVGSCSTMETKYVDRPRDCENVIYKMAQKRALVAATLNFAALSDRFTQDMEDLADKTAPKDVKVKPRSELDIVVEHFDLDAAELKRIGTICRDIFGDEVTKGDIVEHLMGAMHDNVALEELEMYLNGKAK